MKNFKSILFSLLLITTMQAQAVFPIFDPMHHDLSEALGDQKIQVIKSEGCLVFYKKVINTKTGELGELEKIDLIKSLNRMPFCEKLMKLSELAKAAETKNVTK